MHCVLYQKASTQCEVPKVGFFVITHYQRLLDYIVPDKVHVMWEGKIVRSGDKDLAIELESKAMIGLKKSLLLNLP